MNKNAVLQRHFCFASYQEMIAPGIIFPYFQSRIKQIL